MVVVWSIRTVGGLSLSALPPEPDLTPETLTETVSILLPYLQRLRPLLHRPSAEPFLDIHIYLTRSEASAVLPKPISTPASILSPVLDAEDDYTPFITLTTHLGRPQLGQHIDDLLNVGSREMGRVAVSACGPLGLCDRAREAVRERLGGDGVGGDRLFYKEEGGTW